MTIPTIRTVAQLCDENKALSPGGVRWQIFNAADNGLADSGAIIRKGRRIYIIVERYFEWLIGESSAA